MTRLVDYLKEGATKEYKGYAMLSGDKGMYFVDKTDGKTTRIDAPNERKLKKAIDAFIQKQSS
jgi:hypothetical protein